MRFARDSFKTGDSRMNMSKSKHTGKPVDITVTAK